MSTFVLVHGAWHGAWCWYRLIPLLEQAGHRVIAPDLPGHGIDRTPVADVSMDAYVDRVCAALDSIDGKATLVGHSMGGAVITQVAERRPETLQMLVYLTAFLLENGVSLLQETAADTSHRVQAAMIVDETQGCSRIVPQALQDLFYADCPAEDIALAQSLLVPQALAPLAVPMQTSAARFGSVARAYIEATQDNAISLALQRKMQAALPCERVLTLESSHSPFFSQPEALASHLLTLA